MTKATRTTSKVPSAHKAGSYRERTTGCMVDVLDSKKVEAAALKVHAAQWGVTVAALRREGWRMGDRLVLGKVQRWDGEDRGYVDEDRDYGVVCTEGVGYVTDGNGLINVPITFGMGWTQYVKVSAKVLLGCRTGEQIDLADHVRSFGDRLETNYSIWFRTFWTES